VEKAATVVTYKAPPNYAGYINVFPQLVDKSEIGKPVDLTEAHGLSEKYGDRIRIYPAAMELLNGETFALKSRAVCAVGVAENIEEARQVSLEGIEAIKGGALWHRKDVASKQYIEKSIRHIEELRRKK
jgi:phosphoribosylamine-glycine ligase